MSNNIDNLFKKAFDDQKCIPPDYIWKNIEKQVYQPQQIAYKWWFRGIAAAAMIAILLGTWQLNKYSEREQVDNLIVKTYPLFTPLYKGLSMEIKKTTLRQHREAGTPKITTKTQSIPVPMREIDEISLLANSNLSLCIKGSSLENFIPLTSKEALKNNEEYLNLLATEKFQKKKEKIKFELSGHFVPGYSSGDYSSSIKNTRGYNYSKNQMDGIMNAGGGLKLSISKGKRLSFQTGIFYSRMGQKTTENNQRSFLSAFSYRTTPENRVSTPLGNIKSKKKAVAYRSQQATVLNSIANTDETLEQLFGTLEIPLLVRYRLNNNKISFSVAGGFSSNIIINNKVYLNIGNDKELLGSTEDIRKFNMSTDWSVGVEYPITHKVKIMLEPGFKYYLQSLSKNDKIDFKPYLFTLSTGIGIEF